MKKIFLFICIIIFSGSIFGQLAVEKCSSRLLKSVALSNGEKILTWIFFNDKEKELNKYSDAPELLLAPRSIERRKKSNKEFELDFFDLPVNEKYLNELKNIGVEIKNKSKWFNGVSAWVDESQINEIKKLEFVKNLDVVAKLKKSQDIEDEYSGPIQKTNFTQSTHSLDYGNSFTQLNLINVPALHDSGITGEGVLICVNDAGFSTLNHECFDSLTIIAQWDFVDNDGDVSGHSHGTNVLSTIAAYKPGKLIGVAFGADFLLARTEKDPTETPVEEDNWIAAAEWADSIGADVINSSLGYIEFDPPYTSYTWESMDGNTCRITIGADIAVSRGIVVVNSAGNNYYHETHNTLGAPADGDSVISVGAVTSGGVRSSFSSVGNTVDGRIKPDVMAMGSNVYVAGISSTTTYSYSNGTSFSSPLTAGVCALLLSYAPNTEPIILRDVLRNNASQSSAPDRLMGWGIINAYASINDSALPVELTTFYANRLNSSVELKWSTSSEYNLNRFEIQRATFISKTINYNWEKIGTVYGQGNSSITQNYSFIDNTNRFSLSYYRLKMIDNDGTSKFSKTLKVGEYPTEFVLKQNYPNPFNPNTNIEFSVASTANIRITVFNALGEKVNEITNKSYTPGEYIIKYSAKNLTSGVYFYTMETEKFRETKRMVFLK
ncbi:MAG: S8 family peptidase [Ignavibacteriales bacterium]|nr:S8 family peptidase [Ignavibacteriales bacterium]